jgi:hypothetical protein
LNQHFEILENADPSIPWQYSWPYIPLSLSHKTNPTYSIFHYPYHDKIITTINDQILLVEDLLTYQFSRFRKLNGFPNQFKENKKICNSYFYLKISNTIEVAVEIVTLMKELRQNLSLIKDGLHWFQLL